MKHPYTRSERRHQNERALNKTVRIVKHWVSKSTSLKEEGTAWFDRTVQSMHKNRKVCSCQMCRNPRHSSFKKDERLPIQERRELQPELRED